MKLTAAVVLIAATPVWAGPLPTDSVPAGANWIMHLDVRAAAASTVGSHMLENAEAFGLDQALEEARDEFGLDLVHDIEGVTLFGEGDPEETGTLLLITSDRVDQVIEGLAQDASHRTIEIEGYTLHRMDGEQPAYVAVLDGPRRNQRRVVVAGDQSLVVAAAMVIDGRASSLADADRHLETPTPGALLFCVGHGLPWMQREHDDIGGLLRRTNRVRMEVLESGRETVLEVTVSAPSISDATNISQVLQGVAALGRLAVGSSRDLEPMAPLLEGARFSAVRNDVRARIGAPSEMVAQMLEMAAQ